MLNDNEQRLRATDPRRSFIVQAPAGSGKTELLTQRYLRLLSTVDSPEQIIALTFTRKAASEMRERILLALAQAHRGEPTKSAHQQLTLDYATQAIKRCQQFNWQLLKQPGRLKIMTIDALCQSLASAIPMIKPDNPPSSAFRAPARKEGNKGEFFWERQTVYAEISDDPLSLYQSAVRACISYALHEENLHKPLKTILQHLDNRQDKLQQLFCDLLATRQQWLEPLYIARSQIKEHYEQALFYIEEQTLQRFQASIPLHCRLELQQLSCQLAALELKQDSPRFYLKDWYDFNQMDRTIANGLVALLLTGDEKFRQSFDHHVGLRSTSCEKALYNDLKSRSKILLHQLSNSPEVLDLLIEIKSLPLPYYEDSQWQVLQALLTLLPLLAAHLQLQFSEANAVDFTAIAEQAVLALGDEEAPTDLALYMDNAIHHLLVDEFQDTSLQQFQLITKLVQGWLPDEGKTLFLVGDPMQSIYRFRQAEVGLFLKAREQGIGSVSLIPLELRSNFRSTANIIDWVNTQFNAIFPKLENIESGAVSFHHSVANLQHQENSGIFAQQYPSKRDEAQAIVELVARELEHDQQTIAILVRSRQQLTEIIPLLRKNGIAFQGTDIEKLASLPHLQDLWSLTKVLLSPADRLSWLAFLRSPWCGIGLRDLHCLANFDKRKSIFFALANLNRLPELSSEGMLRAHFIYQVMQEAYASRQQQALTAALMKIMNQLHGDKILEPAQQEDIEQFFALLNKFANKNQLVDLQKIELELNELYSQRTTASRLQIMTIHKSKGLEFDCVILPGLGAKSVQTDRPLLRWHKLLNEEILLVAPVNSASEESCLLYNYLGNIQKEKDRYEQQRLLYVAATRAKKKLYLFDYHDKIPANSFKEFLNKVEFSLESSQASEGLSLALPTLSRLPVDFYRSRLTSTSEINPHQALSIPTNSQPRLIGIVAHELLQWICDYHPETINELPWNRINQRFKSLGFTADECTEAQTRLYTQIEALFCDPIGQWLCQKHVEERNEYELLVQEDEEVKTRIIDRTFLDKGCRWIIDFKTGRDDEQSEQKHQQQVNHYASLLAEREARVIRCGLYYLSNNRWLSWDYALSQAASSIK